MRTCGEVHPEYDVYHPEGHPDIVNRDVPPHRDCRECAKWLHIWHDFWCQVAIAVLLDVIEDARGVPDFLRDYFCV